MGKTIDDFRASLTVLRANIALFHQGIRDTYRVVATELRKWLCDKKALLPRVYLSFRPHMLHWTGMLRDCPTLVEGMVLLIPGELRTPSPGMSSFQLKFHKSKTQMDLEEWLDQPILTTEITIRELVRSVANKEGAHSDPEFNETLIKAKLVKYGSDESHIHTIVAIAEYLIAFIDHEQLEMISE